MVDPIAFAASRPKREPVSVFLPGIQAALAAAAMLIVSGCAATRPDLPTSPVTPAGIGIEASHLDPEFWIGRQRDADRQLLEAADIAARNDALLRSDPSMFDLEQLPATLTAEQVRGWIEKRSAQPRQLLFDEQGREISAETLGDLRKRLALDQLPDTQRTRFGLVVNRADLRTFPTRMRVFNSRDSTDIDRFQESALFPATPVAIAHASSDGEWLFVISAAYAAWIDKRFVAEATSQEIFHYVHKSPYLVVTGSTVRTVYSPEAPLVSELQLDMSVRVPLLSEWPADALVNGQHPAAAHVVELPTRNAEGRLQLTPALLPRSADVLTGYLPLTLANLLRQSFKFLGERYGWGHSYNARDCSGFVADLYRSFGVQMPRNTGDQGMAEVFRRLAVDSNDSHEQRLAMLQQLRVGDLVYIPGHVMMVIGHDHGVPFVIHDTQGVAYRGRERVTRVNLNSVAVTPLTPLLGSGGEPLIDRIYSIQRIAAEAP